MHIFLLKSHLCQSFYTKQLTIERLLSSQRYLTLIEGHAVLSPLYGGLLGAYFPVDNPETTVYIKKLTSLMTETAINWFLDENYLK